ncbi:hypothetical protein Bhyg_13098 [Pseudolycoriella hygida]|uniref:Uncharacterized protein n=1 Tax=Pseudolycoriella hygida TaxID=35572 RepID=A0A9Q0S1V3_9DIPT|nr:hypothetical protein Bhyg_13098 [Pseudolycoriella hygida]
MDVLQMGPTSHLAQIVLGVDLHNSAAHLLRFGICCGQWLIISNRFAVSFFFCFKGQLSCSIVASSLEFNESWDTNNPLMGAISTTCQWCLINSFLRSGSRDQYDSKRDWTEYPLINKMAINTRSSATEILGYALEDML